MKHHDPARPVGKCKGCCLNLRTRCAAGFLPKRRWSRGRCGDYGDQALLAQVRNKPAPGGTSLARRRRRTKATLMGTEPHYNGLFDARKVSVRVNGRRR